MKHCRVRPYLSFSQLQAYESNQYVKRYLQGEEFDNKYTRFGKLFHESLIGETEDKTIERIKLFLPAYEQREITIRATVEGIPMLGILDGLDIRGREFGDYKTGKRWTQARADKSEQLTFYWLLLWKKYGWLPERAFIHWIETTEDEGDVCFTGHVQMFKTTRTMADMLSLFARIKKAWVGIEILCTEHLGSLIK